MQHSVEAILKQPEWIYEYWKQQKRVVTEKEIVQILLQLIAENTARKTGGPFSALITDEKNRLLVLAVNSVLFCGQSLAHAEVNALALAQKELKTFDLALKGRLKLYSSAQPCLMCCGAIIWSGIRELIYISSRKEVETILGFDEGFLVRNWKRELLRRKIAVRRLKGYRQQALLALEEYRRQNGVIYNSSRNSEG